MDDDQLLLNGVVAEVAAAQGQRKQSRDDTTSKYPLRSGRVVTKPKDPFAMTKAERKADAQAVRHAKYRGERRTTKKERKHRRRSGQGKTAPADDPAAAFIISLPPPDPSITFPAIPDSVAPEQMGMPFFMLAITPEELVAALSRPIPGFSDDAQNSAIMDLNGDSRDELLADLGRAVCQAPAKSWNGGRNQHRPINCARGSGIDQALKSYLLNCLRFMLRPKKFSKIPGEAGWDMWIRAARSLERFEKTKWLQFQDGDVLKEMIVGKIQVQGVTLTALDIQRLWPVIRQTITNPNYHATLSEYLESYRQQVGPHCAGPMTLMMLATHYVNRRQEYLAAINSSAPPPPRTAPLNTTSRKTLPPPKTEIIAPEFSYRYAQDLEDSDEEDNDGSDHDVEIEDNEQVQGEAVHNRVDRQLIHVVDRFIGWLSGPRADRADDCLNDDILAGLLIGDPAAEEGPAQFDI